MAAKTSIRRIGAGAMFSLTRMRRRLNGSDRIITAPVTEDSRKSTQLLKNIEAMVDYVSERLGVMITGADARTDVSRTDSLKMITPR